MALSPGTAALFAAALICGGCAVGRVAVGVTAPLAVGADIPPALAVSTGLDLYLGPQERHDAQRPSLDPDARCWYAVGVGLRSRFGDQLATVGPALDGAVYCRATPWLGGVSRAGTTFVTFGVERGELAVGLISPHVELGPRLRLGPHTALEVVGGLGYEVRVGTPSYPTGDIRLRLQYGAGP